MKVRNRFHIAFHVHITCHGHLCDFLRRHFSHSHDEEIDHSEHNSACSQVI